MILIKKIINQNLVYLLVFALIMTYPIQVCLKTNIFSYFVYSMIIVYIICSFFKNQINIIYISNIDKLVIAFFTLLILNLFREFYIYEDIINFFRILILYIVPVLFVYIIIYNKNSLEINKLYLSIGTAILIIALELIYEFLHPEVSWFEKENFDYVYEISSQHLFQLLGTLRNNGLMDHIHVTSIFISFGTIITTSIYLFHTNNNKFKILNLLYLALLYLALLLIGVRLILIYFHIWVILIFILGTNNIRINILKLQLLFITLFSGLCLFTFTYKAYFWSAIYLQYMPKEVLDYFEIYELVIKLAY